MPSAPTEVLRAITFQAPWRSQLSSTEGHSSKRAQRSEDACSICGSRADRMGVLCFIWYLPKSNGKVRILPSQPITLSQRLTILLLEQEAAIFISQSTPTSISFLPLQS